MNREREKIMSGENKFTSSKYGTNTLKSGVKHLTLSNLNGEVKEQIAIKPQNANLIKKMKELISK